MELRKDLPVKYHLDLHRLQPFYPDLRDIVFDFCSYIRKAKKRKKHWKPVDMKLPISEFKQVFSEDLTDTIKDEIKVLVGQCNIDGYIAFNSVEEGWIYVTEKGLNLLYTY